MRPESGSRLTVVRRTLVLLLASALPCVAWAVCTCGYGDGQFTLAPIFIDGNMADWAPVHADVDNNVCDGPSGGLTDRDAPVQSTGRDLTHFAYTWDASNIYLFTERFGSASNQQSFVYYADTDNDGLMETNEPVIGVTWRGSNRQINAYVFTYVAQAPGGDPMVDSNGFGDGYSLPGSFANVPPTGSPDRGGPWGSSNGLQMEFFVTWAELGIAPGSPFTFHVSSSNAALGASSFPQQIDDNLSGCGGGLGSTAVRGVSFTPDLSLSGVAGQSVTGAHVLTNTGNADDNFDLSSASAGAFTSTISYYEDVDGSGTVTAADILLTDTDSDGDPDTRVLAPSESLTILVLYEVPGSANPGDVATVTTTAASEAKPLANDLVTDTITLVTPPALHVTKLSTVVRDPVNDTSNPKSIPGSEVEYSISIGNQGAGTVDSDSIAISDPVPANTCLVVLDVAGPGSGPIEFVDGLPSSDLSYTFISLASSADDVDFSNDGGLTYIYTPTANAQGCDPAVTDIQINPKGTFAADAGAGSPNAEFLMRVIVN